MPDVGPYIPRRFTHETEFPQAADRDLQMQLRLIEEKWRRFYPAISYYRILESIGIAGVDSSMTTVQIPAPVGEVGQSGWDPLYGESVDPQMVTDGAWKQPHLDPVLDATTEIEVYGDPEPIHSQMRVEPKERELKQYGFDEKRDLLAIIPATFFDALGFLAREGDKLIWDGEEYVVLDDSGSGFWHNTNIRLYRVLGCEHKRLGS